MPTVSKQLSGQLRADGGVKGYVPEAPSGTGNAYVRKDGAWSSLLWEHLSGTPLIAGSTPDLWFYDTDGTADARKTLLRVTEQSFQIQFTNDAGTGNVVCQLSRGASNTGATFQVYTTTASFSGDLYVNSGRVFAAAFNLPQSAFGTPSVGDIKFDPITNELSCWNGSAWKKVTLA